MSLILKGRKIEPKTLMRQSISFIDVSRTQNFEKIQVKIALPKFLLPLQKKEGPQRGEAN